MYQVFKNRAAHIRVGDQVIVKEDTGESQNAIVQRVQGTQFEVKFDTSRANKVVTANELELSSCKFDWSNITIIADGNPGFKSAQRDFAQGSNFFYCTNHRIARAKANLSKAEARKYIAYVHAYSNFTPEKQKRMKEDINSWTHRAWVHNTGFANQMSWLSPMILINGRLKVICNSQK